MPTTTIRLTEALKARVAIAAEQAGTNAHAFILEAIAEKTERHELQANLEQTANERFERLLQTGETVSWDDMRSYLEKRIAGETAKRPTTRKLGR